MSTAKLNVWITRRSDACHIHTDDQQESYFVHITDCTGHPLVWCGKTYTFLPAKCGHLEIEIPPGCYTVFATHTDPKDGISRPPFGNRLTHVQVVRANCGDHVCVTLFAPGMSNCGTWFAAAVRSYLNVFERANVNVQLARAAATAVEKFIATLEPEPYTANVAQLIEKGPPKK